MALVPEGADPHALTIAARRVLLDALDGLISQREAIILVGAQAVYLRTSQARLRSPAYTSDVDLGLDCRLLLDEPRLEAAMVEAGFVRRSDQPGTWLRSVVIGDRPHQVPVDLLAPQMLVGGSRSRRSAEIPPHHKMAARRVEGLELAAIDCDWMTIASLEGDTDQRETAVKVAGVAALLTAKAYKIYERRDTDRLADKDAGDVLRLMMTSRPRDVASTFARLANDPNFSEVAYCGRRYLSELFGAPRALGVTMAAAALAGDMPRARVAALATAYIQALGE